jgi:hypothetical protein
MQNIAQPPQKSSAEGGREGVHFRQVGEEFRANNGQMVGREGHASIGGGGLPVVHLSCNDGRQIASEHFAENERIFYVLTLAVSRYINTFFYPHIWGIIGRAIELAFLAFKSKLTNNDYLVY